MCELNLLVKNSVIFHYGSNTCMYILAEDDSTVSSAAGGASELLFRLLDVIIIAIARKLCHGLPVGGERTVVLLSTRYWRFYRVWP